MAKDPYRFFRIEGRELVDQITSLVMGLEGQRPDAGTLARALRLAHTLKGAARVVKQGEIADIAHAVEDDLAPYRDSEAAVTRERVDGILARLDAINGLLARLPEPGAEAAPATVDPVATPVATRVVRTDLAELTELLDGLSEIGRELASFNELASLLARSRDIAEELLNRSGKRGLTTPLPAPWVLAHGRADALGQLLSDAETKLAVGIERVSRELRQARDTAERLRLIPAASLFPVLERACRDAAHAMDKQATWHASGGDVLLDGQVLDALQQALVQLVRNAVAHGIETATDRRANAKDERGNVKLQVMRRGHRVIFRCSDDGRGVDFAAVRQALARAGHSDPDHTTLLAALFQGGISTASSVTQIAGRGIGLDLVRDVMASLGGELHAESEPGSGTTIELSVPVSLTAFEALLVEIDDQIVAIPLEAVLRTVRPRAGDVVRSADGDALMLDGDLIPLVATPLRRGHAARMREAWSGVLLSTEGRTAVVQVDRLLGAESIVLRPLPTLSRVDPVVLGCCFDSDGNPRLVLDPGILTTARVRGGGEDEVTGRFEAPILVIDDSLTTRMLEQSILESVGLPVETASSAEEAMTLAERNEYALFLIDVEMPGMDGYTFVERTRAHPKLHRVPCIMVTSCDTDEHRQRARDAGAAAFMVKSQFDQNELLQHIYRLVQA